MIEFASDLESAVKTAEFFGDDPMMVSGALVIECAERLDAQSALIEQQAKEIEALRKALTEIAEWTDRYTSHGHPVSTVAKRALTGQ